MKRLLIPALTLALSTAAMANDALSQDANRSGATASGGTLGAGTVNDRRVPPDSAAPADEAAMGRGERGEPASTVSSGVDRTTTTATTGMPIPFGSADRDNDGYVDRQEAQVLKDSGHDFDSADSDRDDMLSGSEYQRMLGSRTP